MAFGGGGGLGVGGGRGVGSGPGGLGGSPAGGGIGGGLGGGGLGVGGIGGLGPGTAGLAAGMAPGLAAQSMASLAAMNAAQGKPGQQSLANALAGKSRATTAAPSQASKTAAALGPTTTSRLSAPPGIGPATTSPAPPGIGPTAPSPVNTAVASMAANKQQANRATEDNQAVSAALNPSAPPTPEPATPHAFASMLLAELPVAQRGNLTATRAEMEAMADVVANRPGNVKDALHANLQFSPLNRPNERRTLSALPAQNPEHYSQALDIANLTMKDQRPTSTLATNYAAPYANPSWEKRTAPLGTFASYDLAHNFSIDPALQAAGLPDRTPDLPARSPLSQPSYVSNPRVASAPLAQAPNITPNVPPPSRRPDMTQATAAPPAPDPNPSFAMAALRSLTPAPPTPEQRPSFALPAPPVPSRRPSEDDQQAPSLPAQRPDIAPIAAPPAPAQRPSMTPVAPPTPTRRPSQPAPPAPSRRPAPARRPTPAATPPAPEMTAAEAFQSNLAQFGKMMAPRQAELDQQAQDQFDAAVNAVRDPQAEQLEQQNYSFDPNQAVAPLAAAPVAQTPAVQAVDPSLAEVVNPPAVAQALAPQPSRPSQRRGRQSYSFDPNQAVVSASRPQAARSQSQDTAQQDSLAAALSAPPAPTPNPSFHATPQQQAIAAEQQGLPSVPGIAVAPSAPQQTVAAPPAPSRRPAPEAPPAPSQRPAQAQPEDEQSFAERMAQLEQTRQHNVEQAESEYAQESMTNVPGIQTTLDEASDTVAELAGPMSDFAQSRALSRSLLGGSEGGGPEEVMGSERQREGEEGEEGGGGPLPDIFYRSVEGNRIPQSRRQRATQTGNYAFSPRDAQIVYRNINGAMVPMSPSEAAHYDQRP